ncbi:MAG TPA: hypothetical protein VHE82_11765 [Gemmatimonadaceae bacterium]|nr:hypothetical protein [Gemmatimonadaceae bacterium]
MSDRNAAIRALIEHRFPDATPVTHRTVEPVATGIDALDAILPGCGLPRGRLTVWMPQGGATAVLRAACHTTVAQGERAVWIDGLGTVAGPFWEEGPILVRPRNRKHGLRGAEELLRCGGFALLVIAGIEPEGTETVRLSRAAREGGSALVTLTSHASMASLRMTSQILRETYRWRKTPFGDPAEAQEVMIRVRARSLGWNRSADFPVPVVPYDLRAALEPGLADRRGVGSADHSLLLHRRALLDQSRRRPRFPELLLEATLGDDLHA